MVRDRQKERLDELKRKRDSAKVRGALEALTAAAKRHSLPFPSSLSIYPTFHYSGKGNLLELAVTAARERATLGEISAALEAVWGRHVASTQVPTISIDSRST